MKIYIYILIFILPIIGFSQDERQKAVTVSTGGTQEINGTVYSYNIGQTVVSTVSNVNRTVTQGFFQPYIILCELHSVQKTGDGICAASPVSLSLATTKSYKYFNWYQVDGVDTFKVVNETNISYSPNYPGNYFVRYLDEDLICANQTVPEKVDLDASAAIPTVGENGGVLSTTAQGAYQWYVEINKQKYAIYGQNQATYSPIFNGDYYVEVTYGNASNGCKVMSAEVEVNSQSRRASVSNVVFRDNNSVSFSLGEEVSMEVYPYPSSESFTLKMLSDYTGEVLVRLVDLEGKEVSTQQLIKSGAMLKKQISTLGLTEGLYGVMVYTNAGIHTSKMLIIE